MAKTFAQLQEAADLIKNETADGANTAERVGGTMRDIVDKMQSNEELAQTTGNSKTTAMSQDAVTKELTELNSRVNIDDIQSWAPSTQYGKNDFFKIETDAGIFIKKAMASFVSGDEYAPNNTKTAGLDEYLKYIIATQNKDILSKNLNQLANKTVINPVKTHIGINSSFNIDKDNTSILSFYLPVKANMTYTFIKSNRSNRDRIAYLDQPIEDFATGDSPTVLLVNENNSATTQRSVTFARDGYCLYMVTATDEIVDMAVLQDMVIVSAQSSNWGIQGNGKLSKKNTYVKSVIFYAQKGQKYKVIKSAKTSRNRVALMQSGESTWYENQTPDSVILNEENPEDLEKEIVTDFSGWIIWAYTATNEDAIITVVVPPVPRYEGEIIETRSYKAPAVWAKGKIADTASLNVAELNAVEIPTTPTNWGIQGDGTLSNANKYVKAFYFPVKSKTQYRLTKNKASDRDRVAFMFKPIDDWVVGNKPDITILSETDSTKTEYSILSEYDGYISWAVSAKNDTDVTVQIFEGIDHYRCLQYNGSECIPRRMPVIPNWSGWDSSRYNLGYEREEGYKSVYPIYNFMEGVLEVDGFYSVTVGKLSRWQLHLFEGWNKARDKRFTIGIGKFSDDESFIQTFGPPKLQQDGEEHWGSVRIGSDINNYGTVMSPYTAVFNNNPWLVPKKTIPKDMGKTMIKEFDQDNSLKDGVMYNDYYSKELRLFKTSVSGGGKFVKLVDTVNMQAYHYLNIIDAYLATKNPSGRAKYVYQDSINPGAFVMDYSLTADDTVVVELLVREEVQTTPVIFGWRNSGASADGDQVMVLANHKYVAGSLVIYAGKGTPTYYVYNEAYNNRMIILINARQINGAITNQVQTILKGLFPPAVFGLNNQGTLVKSYNGMGFVKMGVIDSVNRVKRVYVPIADGKIKEVVTDYEIIPQDGTCLSFM